MPGHAPWDVRVALDLFLGGLGVGLFLLVVVMRYWGKDRYQHLIMPGAHLAPVLVMAGMLLLMTELGRPDKAYIMMFSFNFASLTAWGTVLQSAFVGVAAGFALLLRVLPQYGVSKNLFGKKINAYMDKMDRVVIAVLAKLPLGQGALLTMVTLGGTVLALSIGFYHGLLLASLGRPLWSVNLIPILFFSSSLLGSAALLLLLDLLAPALPDFYREGSNKHVVYLLGGLTLIQSLLIWLWHGALYRSGAEVRQVMDIMLSEYGAVWFGLVIAAGLAIPLAGWMIGIIKARHAELPRNMGIVLAVLVIVGSFTFKYVVVMAGQIQLSLLN